MGPILSMAVTAVVGIILCVFGAINMTGNISSLHSYHRSRVREEDKKIFGRFVGIGNILIGISIMAFGVLTYIYERTALDAYVIAGTVIMCAGIVIGLGISFFAMIKYNKGIF